MKEYIDDLILQSKTETEFFDILEILLIVCQEIGVKVSATNSLLFTHSIRLCGRIVDETGVKCDSRRLSGLKTQLYLSNQTNHDISSIVNLTVDVKIATGF